MLAPLTAVLALCATTTLAVRPLEIKGADFINSVTGNRFQLLGIAYQPGGQSGYTPGKVDPLSNGTVCLRDAALMQRLGVNSIRVYNIDPNLNHDECASIFNAVGIYMLLDVNSPFPGESINRAEPWTSYYAEYMNRTFAVVEAFKNYPNTAVFFSGNEIINDEDTGKFNPPYIRAVTRDLKNYIAKNSARRIPVGYSAADVRKNLLDSWNYFQCTMTGDTSDPSRGDLFALNSYSWCGDSSFTTSGYNVLATDFAKSSVPVFFSEYGCNEPYPRIFTEVPSLYGPEMTSVLSGGLIYEYSQEPSKYGIVEVADDGSVKLLKDFDSLQAQFNTLNITALQGSKPQNTTIAPPKCTSSLIKTSKFNNNFTMLAVAPGVQALINNGIKNKPVGKIIKITATKVAQKVTASNGNAIEGLEIRVLADDESNAPSGEKPATTSGTPSATSVAPAATSSPSAAMNLRATASFLLGAIFVASWSLLV